MNQKFQKAIDFLLENANPSIKLRVRIPIMRSTNINLTEQVRIRFLSLRIVYLFTLPLTFIMSL